MPNLNDNISNKKSINNNFTTNEIQLFLFIYYNYCSLYSKIKNNRSQHFQTIKRDINYRFFISEKAII